MAYFFCDKCSSLVPLALRTAHRRSHDTRSQWSANRNQAAHARFAKAVKARDGYRCVECGSAEDIRACHIVPIASGGGYDVSNGRTLCKAHDMATDGHAR